MKKNIYSITFFVALMLFIGFGILFQYHRSNAEDDAILGGRQNGLSSYKCQSASSSAAYITAGMASTTCTVTNMEQFSYVDLRFMVKSTSTPSKLHYQLFVTNDDDPATRDWYLANGANSSWGIATTTEKPNEQFKSFSHSSIATKQLKVEYTVTDAASDVYLEVVKDPR